MVRASAAHLVLIILVSRFTALAHGSEIGPDDDFEAAASALQPGEELILRGGMYLFDEKVSISVQGTEERPIIVRAKKGERPVIKQATERHNVIEISNSSHLIVRGITFTGGSHGIRLINADFITIEECEIFETGDVALSANAGGTYEGLRILRNHIHHTNGTGEGMYLGCNNDSCRIANSVIQGNYVHHTNRSGVEQGDGIEIKDGSYGNLVRDNVIHDTKYPGILVYSTAGNGARNIVEGNVVWNVAENTIQIAADAVVRNNIVLGNVAFQRHQSGSPSNIEFVHNTIVSTGSALDIRNVSGRVLVANNAIYGQRAAIRLISGEISRVTLAGNVGVGGLVGVTSGFTVGNGLFLDFVDARYRGRPPIDLFPAEGSALIGAGVAAHVSEVDFNGVARDGIADAGAYAFDEAGNPGWPIDSSVKSLAH